MDGHALVRVIALIFGGLLILLVLLDVFLTVLYARVGAGVFSHQLACWTWKLFRAVAKPFPRGRDQILSFCGPIIIVLLVFVWVFGVMCGIALIVQPGLGTSVAASAPGTPQPHGFVTALYIAGDAMTTVGSTEYRPQTGFYRMLFTFGSVVGFGMITLTLTYLLEIYNALQARNTFAVKLHHASGDTGDAAELVAGVGPRGQFQAGYAHLTEMSAEMIHLFEAHHFYAVLLYFRFREPHYALARVALITLDTVTLIKSALDDEEFGWVKESAAVAQIWRSTMSMLTELATVFLPQGMPEEPEPDAATRARWIERYHCAIDRFREAGIKTIADKRQGEEIYVSLRARWDRYLRAFAEHMVHPMDQVDPVGTNPTRAERRPEFEQRLRAAG
jgi:hypothetical protein